MANFETEPRAALVLDTDERFARMSVTAETGATARRAVLVVPAAWSLDDVWIMACGIANFASYYTTGRPSRGARSMWETQGGRTLRVEFI